MKRNNKKGFTIVELVIVIAVIGILAAVLIPTFSSIITEANKSADLQTARNEYTEYLVKNPTSTVKYVLQNGKYYNVDDFDADPATTLDDSILYLNAANGKLEHGADCADTNNDHNCDKCGEHLADLCVDTVHDHKCDTCGHELGNCDDAECELNNN